MTRRRLWASDSYGFVLAAHAGQSQGRPHTWTSSQLKGIRRPAQPALSREAPTSEAPDATHHTGRPRLHGADLHTGTSPPGAKTAPSTPSVTTPKPSTPSPDESKTRSTPTPRHRPPTPPWI